MAVAAATAVALIAIVLAGCLAMFPPLIAESEGTGTMTISVLGALPMTATDTTLHIELTRDGHKLQQQVPFADGPQTVTIENIAAGPWGVKVKLLDETGVPTHEGGGTALVYVGTTAHVNITLYPRPGQLEVTIALGEQCIYVGNDGCLADSATAGRVYIHPGVNESTDRHDFPWTSGEAGGTVPAVTLPPGSYDFQIVFYEGSRIPSNEVFVGFWTPFDILPGRTTSAVWHPEIGLLDVAIDVQGPPQAPRSLTATAAGGDIVLTWEPPSDALDDDVTGHKVYGRRGVREAFRLLTDVPAPTTEWRHTDSPTCDDEAADPFYYVVTAVNQMDYESLRSNEATICEQ